VFGRYDDRGAVEKPALREGEYHLFKGSSDEVECMRFSRPARESRRLRGSRLWRFPTGQVPSWKLAASGLLRRFGSSCQ
jgi:hypothetical protein